MKNLTKALCSIHLLAFSCSAADLYQTLPSGSTRTADAGPACLLPVGSSLYFLATSAGKQGLWKTDGTASGTVHLRDAYRFACPVNANGTIFFFADGGLWKSDGTTAGTVHVTDLPSGFSPADMLSFNGGFLFYGTNSFSPQLWKSDGTSAGTTLLGVVTPDLDLALNLNGTVFFPGTDSTGVRGLWKTDGSPMGTVVVKVFPQRIAGSFAALNGAVFFPADDGVHGQELWKSDGTPAGTLLVKDIFPGPAGSSLGSLTAFQGKLYFTASAVSTGFSNTQLWTSDGTEEGTVAVTAQSGTVQLIGHVNGALLFQVVSGVTQQLWKSDGTSVGTSLLSSQVGFNGFVYFATIGSRGFFLAADSQNDPALWSTDATPAGTALVQAFAFDPIAPLDLVAANGIVYFVNGDAIHGTELWKSDGTSSGTAMVVDLNTAPLGSQPFNLVTMNGAIYYVATSDTLGTELWRSDGTVAGTGVLKDLYPGLSSSNPSNLTVVNGTLYFTAYYASGQEGLFKSDGTASGTTLIRTVSFPSDFIGVNGNLLFMATGPTDQAGTTSSLYRSDGTDSGTVLLASNLQIVTSFVNNNLTYNNNLTVAGSRLFLTSGAALWASDGSAGGTIILKQLSNPSNLTAVGSTLFFTDSGSQALWKSDGTAAGTTMVAAGFPGSSPFPSADTHGPYMANVGGTVFFVAGGLLWKSDGTAAGTVQVSANPFISITGFTPSGNVLYFGGADNSHFLGLWRSDGTSAGTAIVDDLSPTGGMGFSNPIVLNGTIFFDTVSAPGLNPLPSVWRSDGTQAGSRVSSDIFAPQGAKIVFGESVGIRRSRRCKRQRVADWASQRVGG